MLSPSNLLSLALLYVCVLFAVAWYADRSSDRGDGARSPVWRGLIYALTLAVYCSSWTFYGAVGSATASAWSHAPIYLGPILLFLLAWPLVRRLMAVGTRHRVTSIADYIGARFGKRRSLAILVTAVATAAVLPYIALQFKALAQAWMIVGGSVEEVEAIGGDTALLTAIILAVFTILFGTRRLDGRERHQGVMSAIAVESVVKLLAFITVAGIALAYLIGEPEELGAAIDSQKLHQVDLSADFLAQTLISALAILCLPRQFHVMVVEAQESTDTRIARWLFPLYLTLFMLLVVPISLAGSSLYAGVAGVNPDTYVQLLPITLESNWVTVAAFIGGISAATGMVIVATVSLAIMITNEVVAPFIMRASTDSPGAILRLGDKLRRVRQITIGGILLAAWLVTRQLMGIPWLTEIGFISFLAAAQLAPAVIAGLYWRRAHGIGVILGLVAGLALWLYCSLLPAVLTPGHWLLAGGPLGVSWLSPENLLGISGQSRLAYATVWSLGLNSLLLVLFSLLLRPSPADVRQARIFMDPVDDLARSDNRDFDLTLVRVSQLQALLPPFVETEQLRRMWRSFEDAYQQRLLPADRAPRFVVEQVESALAGIIGATSAQTVMEQLERSQQLAYSDLAGMVSEASKLQTFNRELLETTVESLIQGVSVVDKELRLVAWNRRYEEMFGYPERFLYVGCPIERVYRFNAQRGILGGGGRPIDEEVERRLTWLREGSPHRLERIMPDGSVFDIRGIPMPNGGFVTTYIDITDYREVVTQLEEAKQELEAKVASGTRTLSETNALLRQENRLRAQVEARLRDANRSKSRFMSATSHDLLQPINAARLFVAALGAELDSGAGEGARTTVDRIDASLNRAEQLISELREIARLDSGRHDPAPQDFSAGDMMCDLVDEFTPQAAQKGLRLVCSDTTAWVHTDPSLARRVLQNLLSNAIKYTREGRVLLGARRRPGGLEVQVLDTGPGIPESEQVRIFQEFERLDRHSSNGEEGLGLGLAIVQRYAQLLDLPLRLHSQQGRGSLFSVLLPYGKAAPATAPGVAAPPEAISGTHVLCLDNESLVRDGLVQLLRSMSCSVTGVADRLQFSAALDRGPTPDVLLVDYHLDDGDTGIDVVRDHFAGGQAPCPVVVVSADDSAATRERTRHAGFRFLPKPVNPARLRALLLALKAETGS